MRYFPNISNSQNNWRIRRRHISGSEERKEREEGKRERRRKNREKKEKQREEGKRGRKERNEERDFADSRPPSVDRRPQ